MDVSYSFAAFKLSELGGLSMVIEKELVSWLQSLPDWQQQAAEALLSTADLSPKLIATLTSALKSGADGSNMELATKRTFPFVSLPVQAGSVQLVSVGQIRGIENLNPRKPLKFGTTNLFVVYGHNGSGKSGYVRLMKKACGKSDGPELRTNLFAELPAIRACRIEYKVNGIDMGCDWNVAKDAEIRELAGIDIFDADTSRLYVSREKEASYTPPILALFDGLVKVNLLVRQLLQSERDSLVSKFPSIPANLRMTTVATKLQTLKASDVESLEVLLSWTDDDEKELRRLEQRLLTEDPASLSTKLRNQIRQIENILLKVDAAISALSEEACMKLSMLRSEASHKRNIAREGVDKALNSVPLDGIVSSDTWRAMWEAARQYSQGTAYKNAIFPNVSPGALCVLCNQPIQEDAANRLTQFEDYIKSKLESDALEAESLYSKALATLPDALSEDLVKMACQAAGIHENEVVNLFLSFWHQVSLLVHQLRNTNLSEFAGLQNHAPRLRNFLKSRTAELESQAQQLESDATSFDRQSAVNEKLELSARQWISQQAEELKLEQRRRTLVAEFDKWIRQTDSTAISKKSGEFAERFLTSAYIERFNDELRKLGAGKIKVELVKTRTDAGRALHAVKLRGAVSKSKVQLEILSDGEKRIVGLAAFLADVTGRPATYPFIFDDPISSLDQDYEEKTIDRLIELSKSRQVIIFTHRLSFFGIINDKVAPESICIRQEHWGAGEPSNTPIFAKKPMNSLNELLNERLKQAENVWKSEGSDAYYPLARSICSDFRILIERVIEHELLADVVARHRRDIMTKGKIQKLSKIEAADCQLFSDLMTEYSRFEHSQSYEAPVEVPEPDVLRNDINKVISWHSTFVSR
jgi:energy-coupling factor transporter ATP-binding protein EcfA2